MRLDSTVSAVATGGASGLGAAGVRALAAAGAPAGVPDLHADAGNAMNSYVNGETVRLDGAIRVGSR